MRERTPSPAGPSRDSGEPGGWVSDGESGESAGELGESAGRVSRVSRESQISSNKLGEPGGESGYFGIPRSSADGPPS